MIWTLWLISGFAAYGLTKGCSRNLCRSVPDRYVFKTELISLTVFVLGPLGLLMALIDNITLAHAGLKPWGFCIKIPKELKTNR